MSDGSEQGRAEALDDDKLGGADLPPDEPAGLADLVARDVETVGEYAPDSVTERTGREEPEVLVDDTTALPGGIVAADGEPDLAAELGEGDGEDVVHQSEELAPRPEDPSPEEAAMHLVDEDGRVPER